MSDPRVMLEWWKLSETTPQLIRKRKDSCNAPDLIDGENYISTTSFYTSKSYSCSCERKVKEWNTLRPTKASSAATFVGGYLSVDARTTSAHNFQAGKDQL